ncbi:hypothetical protein OG21DRAFT_1501724 [Imleria badia]|nr:hypothetical protein OG21DRAFT_1501724 [Imleria badia]
MHPSMFDVILTVELYVVSLIWTTGASFIKMIQGILGILALPFAFLEITFNFLGVMLELMFEGTADIRQVHPPGWQF